MSETQENNKALVRRLHELVDRGYIEAMEKLLAPDFVDHSLLPDQDPGREGYLQSVAKEHSIFSNIRHIIEDQVAEGDKVTSRITASRIHAREGREDARDAGPCHAFATPPNTMEPAHEKGGEALSTITAGDGTQIFLSPNSAAGDGIRSVDVFSR